MAIVKILNIKSKKGIANATKYVKNDEKTDASKREKTHEEEGIQVGVEHAELGNAIGNVIDYASNSEKTEEQHLITGINCTVHHAAEEMEDLAEYWKQAKGIEGVSRDAFHIIQSLDPKDNDKLTPEEAHQIGLEYADALRYMDDKQNVNRNYMALVCTHVDKEHYHNHIILCSYDIGTGKKFHECRDVYRQMREANDRICKEHGLHVLEDPDFGRGHSRKENEEEKNGTSWKDNLRKDIEAMASVSSDWDSYVKNMEAVGYGVKEGKYVTYSDTEGHKVRDFRLGREWTKDSLIKQWEKQQELIHGTSIQKERIKRFFQEDDEKRNKEIFNRIHKMSEYQDGHRLSELELLIVTAIDMIMPDADDLYLTYPTYNDPGKEKERRIAQMNKTIDLAKEAGIHSDEELLKRMNDVGTRLSHVNKELKKNIATKNRMDTVRTALEEREDVYKIAQSIDKLDEGEIKEALKEEHAAEIEQYKKAMSVLYRYHCTTPEEIEDFHTRYEKVERNIASYQEQAKELRTEYKTLSRIKHGVELARNHDFLGGRYYDDPDQTEPKPEERAEEAAREETQKEATRENHQEER